MGRAGQLAATVRAAQKLDKDWLGRVPEDAARRHLYTPWIPFSVPGFLAMLFEALPEVPPDSRGELTFLEIGCGPGSKLLLARDVAGLDAHGIERVRESAAAARSLGLDAETADARDWKGYGNYGLLWLNRPLRDPDRERRLEARIWSQMAPGAVVMCAALETSPPGWDPVLEDRETRREIWAKPLQPAG